MSTIKRKDHATSLKVTSISLRRIPVLLRLGLGVLLFSFFLYLFLLYDILHVYQYTAAESQIIMKKIKNQCWLRNAFRSGDFVVFSHRSYFSANESSQSNCKESIMQLKNIGVHSFDLDLVLHESSDNAKLIVSHPMEFKRESDNYSPCSLLSLDEVIFILDEVYGKQRNWFFSLEPKASWGRTEKEKNDIALVEPVRIMTELLSVITENNLEKNQCAVIIDANYVQGKA